LRLQFQLLQIIWRTKEKQNKTPSVLKIVLHNIVHSKWNKISLLIFCFICNNKLYVLFSVKGENGGNAPKELVSATCPQQLDRYGRVANSAVTKITNQRRHLTKQRLVPNVGARSGPEQR
jgi:hypothetical protein